MASSRPSAKSFQARDDAAPTQVGIAVSSALPLRAFNGGEEFHTATVNLGTAGDLTSCSSKVGGHRSNPPSLVNL
jgi:hypothetical protein